MSTEPVERITPTSKTSRWRFSLRTLFIVVTLICIFGGMFIHPAEGLLKQISK